MPRRRMNKRFRGRRSELVRFPITYYLKEGETATSTAETIGDAYDRTRAFRVAEISGKMASDGHAVPFYYEFFGPVSSSDNVWTSPIMLAVPNGTRFRFRIPVTSTGWYPSQTAVATPLFRLVAVCVSPKNSALVGSAIVTISLRPLELANACVALTTGDLVLPSPPDSDPDSDSSGDFNNSLRIRLNRLRENK